MDIESIKREALQDCAEQFARIDAVSLKNTEKVLQAYRDAKLSAFHFSGTSGYGYNDLGREKLDEVFSFVFKAEKAVVRPHFVSGTHALATVLCAILEKGICSFLLSVRRTTRCRALSATPGTAVIL